jgi:N-acetylneuraminate synthase
VQVNPVQLGPRLVGPDRPALIIAELGINHYGDLDTAKAMIDAAVDAGADIVKFQKRTVDIVYTPEELDRPRESPFGTTNGDLKRALEFGYSDYEEINRYCEARIGWTASCWDLDSVDMVASFKPPFHKIASATLTDDHLLAHIATTSVPIVLSTGGSTLEQIDHALEVLGHEELVLMHCNSTYPAPTDELNLRAIPALIDRYDVPVGYSGHDTGVWSCAVAVAMGACVIERHLTLDRAMFGSDQAASLEPGGFKRMVDYVRGAEAALGDGVKRVYPGEVEVMAKLRRVEPVVV